MKKILYLFLFSSIISCTDDRLFEENIFIKDQTLNTKEKLSYSFEVQDTNAHYDVFANIRITSEYPYSNMFLLVTATNPEGKAVKELVEYTLADVSGKWLGRGLGDIYDYRLLHDRLKGLEMKKPGKYTFELNQVMRVDDLKGVSALGLRVVKH
ncbi:MAG: gliding motility lipoprotein GldH [Bacteroidetes bacterium]|nr:gliding motility lipoprotein GldH [Bacteroidota bacterium]